MKTMNHKDHKEERQMPDLFFFVIFVIFVVHGFRLYSAEKLLRNSSNSFCC